MGNALLRQYRETNISGLEPRATFVLLLLCDSAHDKDLHVWLGHAAISRLTNLAERTVRRAIDELVTAGRLEVVRRGNGAKHPTVYRVRIGLDEAPAHTWDPDRRAVLRKVGALSD